MVARGALKLVERPSFYVEEGELWDSHNARGGHSLHYAISYLAQTPPELVSFAINRFSKRGDVVLDPFMGAGTVALESLLSGRLAYGSDVNPLWVRLARAKLLPADISEVTLRLQLINLRRPVAVEEYRPHFDSFYDLDTFREILGLKAYLASHDDRVSRFIECIALSLMHGHSAGFFSVYSMPHMGLSATEQERLNRRRAQSPEYRAVVPRILRRAAMALRDGVPSMMVQLERQSKISLRDARDLSYVTNAEVGLIVTSPPLPGARPSADEQWLRLWMSGIDPRLASSGEFCSSDLNEWSGFMNEALLELARVAKRGARCALNLREVQLPDGMVFRPDEELVRMCENELSRYWDAECMLVHRPPQARVQHQLKPRETSANHRLLVLRRR